VPSLFLSVSLRNIHIGEESIPARNQFLGGFSTMEDSIPPEESMSRNRLSVAINVVKYHLR
jgi:hypothetical protein